MTAATGAGNHVVIIPLILKIAMLTPIVRRSWHQLPVFLFKTLDEAVDALDICNGLHLVQSEMCLQLTMDGGRLGGRTDDADGDQKAEQTQQKQRHPGRRMALGNGGQCGKWGTVAIMAIMALK